MPWRQCRRGLGVGIRHKSAAPWPPCSVAPTPCGVDDRQSNAALCERLQAVNSMYPSWMISTMGSADVRRRRQFDTVAQRVGFKQADPVAGLHGGDREPDGECALASAALARNQSDRVHGVFVSSLRIVKVCCYARQIRRYKARTCPQTSRAAIRKTAYASLNKLLIVSVRKEPRPSCGGAGWRIWRNCSIFSGWRDHPQGRFSCSSRTVRAADCSKISCSSNRRQRLSPPTVLPAAVGHRAAPAAWRCSWRSPPPLLW